LVEEGELHFLNHLARSAKTGIHPWGDRATQFLLEALELQPGQLVLEIGCGTGGTLVWVHANADIRLFAIDLLIPMIVVARNRTNYCGLAHRTFLTIADGRRLPFLDNTFDRIYIESVLGFQTGQDIRSMLGQIHKILKTSGRCVINESIWMDTVSKAKVDQIVTESIHHFGLPPATKDGWYLQDWQKNISRAGFTILSNVLFDERSLLRPQKKDRDTVELLDKSTTFSRYHRARSYLSIPIIVKKIQYRIRQKKVNRDQQVLEARLFILEKTKGFTQKSR
jgi:ubiquinone/menaquinone biosynthesis C-methylase UbiE